MAGLKLTPDMLVATYEMLHTTLPFRRWGLPHADDIEFHVTSAVDYCGQVAWRGREGGPLCIQISQRHVQWTHDLVETMAHEMCHVRQIILRPGLSAYGHKKDFRDMAKQVCRHHGFNPQTF